MRLLKMLRRSLVFSVLLSLAVCKRSSIQLQRDKDNIPIFPNAQLTSANRPETKKLSCPERRLAICSFDCTYIQFCVNGYISNTITIECPNGTLCDQNKQTPICSKNIQSCIPTNITAVKTDLELPTCEKPKFNRDLQDCRKYTYCEPSGSYEYRCDNSTVFDEKTFKCVKNLKCVSFSDKRGGLCFKKTEQNYVSDPTNEKRYVKCTNPPRFIFCPDKYIFNQVKQGCEFKCLKEGRFKDPLDSTNRIFYECRKGSVNGNNLFPIERTCPQGTVFDKTVCVFRLKSFSVNTTTSSIKTMSTTQQIICPQNYNFNLDSQECEYVCNEEGNFPDFTDPTGVYYLECKKNGSEYVSKRQMCNEEMLFDFLTGLCINPFRNAEDIVPDETVMVEDSNDSKVSGNKMDAKISNDHVEEVKKQERINEESENIKDLLHKPEEKELKNLKDKLTVVKDKVDEFTGKIKLIQGELKKKNKPADEDEMDEPDYEEHNEEYESEKDAREIKNKKLQKLTVKEINKEIVDVKEVNGITEGNVIKLQKESCGFENYVYTSNICEFKCPKEGNFPDFKDPSHEKYYQCLPSTGQEMIAVHRTCPEMTKFNIFSKICLFSLPDVPILLQFACKEGYEFNPNTNKCEYKCKAEGLFKDMERDSFYYECIKGDTGEYQAIHKKCQQPNLEICSTFENIETGKVPIVFETDSCQFNCVNEGLFVNSEDLSGSKYYECVSTSVETKNLVAFCRSCPENTTFHPIEKMCVLNSNNLELNCKEGFVFKKESQSCEVVCEEQGLFKDTDDSSGSYYYECSVDTLKDEISVIRKKCPENEIFHFEKRTCVKSNILNDDSTQIINLNVETAEEPDTTTEKAQVNLNDSSVSTNSKCDQINYMHVSENGLCEFVCPTEGRFPDFEDQSKYYECTLSDNPENMTRSHLVCPEGTVFNPRAKICSFTTTKTSDSGSSCPSGYKYNFDSLSCEFICLKEGIFLDPGDETKSHYYECICIHPGSKEVFPARKKCGGISTFDETTKTCKESVETSVDLVKCSVGYKFDTMKQKCEFDCKLEGKFLDPADTSGIYYFECVRNEGREDYSAERRKCPEMTTFNHVVGICIFLIGNMNQIMDGVNETESLFCKHKNYKYNIESRNCEFVCPDEGQYPDFKDPTNVKYYECLKDAENGKVLGVHRLCPEMTVFNPIASVCTFLTPTSICPKGFRFNLDAQKCEFNCEKEGFFKDEADSLDVYYFECRTDASTNKILATRLRCSLGEVFDSVQSKCLVKSCDGSQFIYNPVKRVCEFKCPYEGRFPDSRDSKNLWYYECLNTGSEIVGFHKICPEETEFDPVIRICHFGQKSKEAASKSSVCFEGYRFDKARQVCEFHCEKEGRFVDWADATSVHYYECIKISRSKRLFSVIRRKCFGKTTFDSIAGICLSPLRRQKIF